MIKTEVWTYPPNVILGPTLFRIPAEELFFFVIQTYNTSLLYLILSKPTFHPAYLRGNRLLRDHGRMWMWGWLGIFTIIAGIVSGIMLILKGGTGLYIGLIIAWAGPFILLLWCVTIIKDVCVIGLTRSRSLAYQFIIGLPISNTLIPIVLPTLYLWIVDTLALKRGTWVIESGTKLDWHLWEGLDIEEAVFFLVTNMLIVFGLVAFDNAFAILATFPQHFPEMPSLPSPLLLVQALLLPTNAYDDDRIEGLRQALALLRAKSRSFYLASGVFQGRLRIDLVLLYSFCRVADDLVDEAGSVEAARHWVVKLNRYLDITYKNATPEKPGSLDEYINSTFPESAKATLRLLPTSCLSPTPLYDLLKGFEMDLLFSSKETPFPIKDVSTLQIYASQVAGTVAKSCLELVYYHTTTFIPEAQQKSIVAAGARMGIALQYMNIARDIAVDAGNSRVYLPSTWLYENYMTPSDVIKDSSSPTVEVLRQRLLDRSMVIYEEAKNAIEELPLEARGPMRVAVESYVEIGRVLRQPGYKVKAGRATVSKLRRLRVAWNALQQK